MGAAPRPHRHGARPGPVLPSEVMVRRSAPVPSEVYDTYWRFAFERQEVFFRRLEGLPPPWTGDPILREHRFTNPYRASDRVSQYLIRNVICSGSRSPADVLFRVLLFKFFNKIETWELLTNRVGEISWAGYSYDTYDETLTAAIDRGVRIYSAAYIMPSASRGAPCGRKHRGHLRLIERIVRDGTAERLAAMRSMREGFELLRSYPMLGDFLAYQYVTDINYSELTGFSEMDHVVPGPGARDGIRKAFRDLGDFSEGDVIRAMADRQEREFERLNLQFRSLWGRRLQLIDCQNLFCEVDKYARVAHPLAQGITGRTRIKQKYWSRGALPEPFFPPKWKVNQCIILPARPAGQTKLC